MMMTQNYTQSQPADRNRAHATDEDDQVKEAWLTERPAADSDAADEPVSTIFSLSGPSISLNLKAKQVRLY